MKKSNVLFLTAVVLIITSCAFIGGRPSGMMVYTDCRFSVESNIFHVEVGKQEDFYRNYNLDRWQVTIITNIKYGTMELSVHRKGADYWRVPNMYDINSYQVEKIRLQIKINEITLTE
jgi:hypothetical protein